MRTERLRETRDGRGFSQEELAKRCGMSTSQIFRIESGKSDPSAEAIARIARELEVSTDYLLGLVDNPTERLQIEEFSLMERRLIQAVRKGLIVEALEVMTTLSKESDQARTTPDQP